ncbi:hypothetical protein [Micromonospora deserti]|uniref:HEAT repeat domain-containing protein n=1 Tax=Micromonospora deserti TaxID=2070366 RepID=A0A2W2CTF9_9ACTN|nr:hypothetical protein [Micromonospora deserti]PZG01131.1 hypothetical protein C1I99_08225 [Micromonospora deserti]
MHDDTDLLLRGLVWALSRDPGEAATKLLGRVTATAAAAPRDAPGSPCARRTAVAAVPLLAGRDGETPARVLTRLSATVRNKAVRARVQAALIRP